MPAFFSLMWRALTIEQEHLEQEKIDAALQHGTISQI